MSDWDVCVECGARLLTLANSNRVVDQKILTAKHMPKGGCQCGDFEENLGCVVCFPTELRCKDHPRKVHENFSCDPDGQLKLQLAGVTP